MIYEFNEEESLSENTFQGYLPIIFPEIKDWVRNKTFPGHKFRPDYRSDTLKMCIEIDDHRHYTQPISTLEDCAKETIMMENGYTVVHIPMYVQMSKRVVKHLFKNSKIVQKYY